MEYKLKFPIKARDGKTLTSVTYRERVLVSDVMYVAEHATSAKVEGVWMVARLCGLDVSEIELMDLEDYNEIYTKVIEGKELGSG